ncbi:MAG: hypothetical protein J0I49_35135 [Pseudonocardia sp.]|uniref:hypothetical protein n=1 Tax=Pseudonocardia sp. TaxID=60912 RepID=UPI001AC6CC24|nr:hypothetical protein [Pseudonocardia sp.]MBN9103290.1 hypothetical protein [Pseudonocardia sp.]
MQHRHVDVARVAAEVQRGPVVVVGGVRQEVAQVGISSDPTFSRASEPIQFTVQSSSRTPLR